jgi:uncharacterized protein (TIGR00369 family)
MEWLKGNLPRDEEMWKEGWKKMLNSTAAGAHDVELVRIDDEGLELRLEITDSERQPFGLFHGGVSMLLAESAASMHCCWGTDLSDVAPVGIEINGSHLSSAREGHVLAVATVIRRGKTTAVHEVDIFHEESGRPLCRARVTNLFVPHR